MFGFWWWPAISVADGKRLVDEGAATGGDHARNRRMTAHDSIRRAGKAGLVYYVAFAALVARAGYGRGGDEEYRS